MIASKPLFTAVTELVEQSWRILTADNAEEAKAAFDDLLQLAQILLGVDFSDFEYTGGNGFREDVNNALAFGLCKKYGIDLPEGAGPKEAWEALKNEMGEDVTKEYQENFGNGKPISIPAAKYTKEYLSSYEKEHPEIREESKKYSGVLEKVKNFLKENPDLPDDTYDAFTGKPAEGLSGYQVTFHQNHSKDDFYKDYSDDDYAMMCAVAMRETGSDRVFIGKFGNPEVSFNCKDLSKAMSFMRDNNQNSAYMHDTGKLIINPEYDEDKNPIPD